MVEMCCGTALFDNPWHYIRWKDSYDFGDKSFSGRLSDIQQVEFSGYPANGVHHCGVWFGQKNVPHIPVCDDCLRRVGLLW